MMIIPTIAKARQCFESQFSENVDILILYFKTKQFYCCYAQIYTLYYIMTLTVNFASPAVHLSDMTFGRATVDTIVSAYQASLPFLQLTFSGGIMAPWLRALGLTVTDSSRTMCLHEMNENWKNWQQWRPEKNVRIFFFLWILLSSV